MAKRMPHEVAERLSLALGPGNQGRLMLQRSSGRPGGFSKR